MYNDLLCTMQKQWTLDRLYKNKNVTDVTASGNQLKTKSLKQQPLKKSTTRPRFTRRNRQHQRWRNSLRPMIKRVSMNDLPRYHKDDMQRAHHVSAAILNYRGATFLREDELSQGNKKNGQHAAKKSQFRCSLEQPPE